jgi:chromosome segregation ATPase
VRSGLYQQWDEADKSLSARIKTCGELLKSAGERSDEARTTLGRWFEGVLGLDRKRRDLVAECESLAAVKLAGRSVDAARGFVARLVTLEAGVQEYAGGVDSDIAKADKQQQREQWDKEQAEHRAQLDEIDAKIAAAKHQKLVLDEEIKSGQRKEESDSDWKARQRRLNDDLKTVASDIARLNVSRSQHEQALKRPFSPKSRHGNDAKKTSSKGFVPAPAKASARLRVPAEALPSVGELFETETERYLAIDTWEQYDLGRAEAARLKARLVARRR